jgi:hypothetical protein
VLDMIRWSCEIVRSRRCAVAFVVSVRRVQDVISLWRADSGRFLFEVLADVVVMLWR